MKDEKSVVDKLLENGGSKLPAEDVRQALKDALRRQGHSRLHGRPLDENGTIELRVEDPHP